MLNSQPPIFCFGDKKKFGKFQENRGAFFIAAPGSQSQLLR